jgi:hypothetical protein
MGSVDNSSYGAPSLQIKPLYIRAALELLIDGADRLRTKKLVTVDMDEGPITNYLSFEMKSAQRAGKSDIIFWDIRVDTQSDFTDPQLIGEIDFKFRWAEYPDPNDYDRYLAVEAKRLFGKGDSLLGKYVEKGLMDFVVGKYGRGHNYGIMLGYILVGPLATAVARVSHAMKKRKMLTEEHSAFTPDCSLCLHPNTHHSIHLQQGTGTLITLVHVFLDFS